MRTRGVLFDVDGTLVDSGYIHAVCWWQALRQHGHDIPTALIHRSVGMGGDQLVPHVLGKAADDMDADELSALIASHDALYATYWDRLQPLPGARELVRRCHDAGLSTVLASSASSTELGVLRAVLDLDDVLDHVTSSDDSEASKPDPGLVEVALDKAGLQPHEMVFLGDSVWDVQAAAKAGVECLGVECGGTSEAELREAGATDVFRNPADLLERWAHTPLGTSQKGHDA
ncbi:HAD family hydrolase [uncultured Jatrophihabitans sp.]|uniref:HAD family hydrolase n=1 Tax=uncultured Jatrophihabitans sp. TaxID=1610747 RepID=UPI0035CA09EA